MTILHTNPKALEGTLIDTSGGLAIREIYIGRHGTKKSLSSRYGRKQLRQPARHFSMDPTSRWTRSKWFGRRNLQQNEKKRNSLHLFKTLSVYYV